MSKPWCSPSILMEKRMGAFIDKAIIVLKALIVFLELIRMFF
ncbi:damage-inducible type I toxin DinQ [Yersinia enterocolitica]